MVASSTPIMHSAAAAMPVITVCRLLGRVNAGAIGDGGKHLRGGLRMVINVGPLAAVYTSHCRTVFHRYKLRQSSSLFSNTWIYVGTSIQER